MIYSAPLTMGGGTARLLPFDGHRLDSDGFQRRVAGFARRRAANLVDETHARDDLAEDAVLVVEPRRRHQRDEELPAVGVGPAVGHRQNARLVVAQLRVELVGEVVARASGALAERIAALDHEIGYHAVEDRAVVVRLFRLSPGPRVGPLLGAFGETGEI